MSSPNTHLPTPHSELECSKIKLQFEISNGSVRDVLPPGSDDELVVSISGKDAAFTKHLGRPDATREKLEDGWYRTGDSAVLFPGGDVEIRAGSMT
jgi:acyl-CoA synthetase (AMP-forming)/AMP-acid ligase II